MSDVLELPIVITKTYNKNINGKIVNLSKINGKKTCVVCFIEKDISEFYDVGGCCKLCRKNKYKEKSLTKKIVENYQRLYYKNINGQNILLTAINGRKICCNCLIEQDVSEFYGKGNKLGLCKTCTLIKNKKKYYEIKQTITN